MSVGAIIGFALSPQGVAMYNSGIAALTAGGIRSVETGKMLELAKPVISFVESANSLASTASSMASLATPLAAVNIVADVVGHAYTAVKLNGMDNKLDSMIKQLNSIAAAVGRINTIEILSWATLGMQLVNVGVSAIGFYLTMQKLNSIGGELHTFYERYQYDREADRLEKYRNHMSGITNQMAHLQERYEQEGFDERDFLNRAIMIEKECSETGNFLLSTLQGLMNGKVEHRLGCQIIFTLTPAFGGLVNEFCAQYRCVAGRPHRMFDHWCGILEQINSEDFRQFMLKQMAFNPYYADVSPEKRYESLRLAFGSIVRMQNMLRVCRDALEEAKPDRLVNPDELINMQAWSALGRELGAESSEELADLFDNALHNALYLEGDNTYFVPLKAVTV